MLPSDPEDEDEPAGFVEPDRAKPRPGRRPTESDEESFEHEHVNSEDESEHEAPRMQTFEEMSDEGSTRQEPADPEESNSDSEEEEGVVMAIDTPEAERAALQGKSLSAPLEGRGKVPPKALANARKSVVKTAPRVSKQQALQTKQTKLITIPAPAPAPAQQRAVDSEDSDDDEQPQSTMALRQPVPLPAQEPLDAVQDEQDARVAGAQGRQHAGKVRSNGPTNVVDPAIKEMKLIIKEDDKDLWFEIPCDFFVHAVFKNSHGVSLETFPISWDVFSMKTQQRKEWFKTTFLQSGAAQATQFLQSIMIMKIQHPESTSAGKFENKNAYQAVVAVDLPKEEKARSLPNALPKLPNSSKLLKTPQNANRRFTSRTSHRRTRSSLP